MNEYQISIPNNRGAFFDDDDWVEGQLYSRRHDGLYESRLEKIQREWQEEQED